MWFFVLFFNLSDKGENFSGKFCQNNSIKNYESPILWFNFSDLLSCILTKSFSFLTNAVWKIVWEGIIGLEQHGKSLAKGISSTTHKLYGNNKYNNILKSVKKIYVHIEEIMTASVSQSDQSLSHVWLCDPMYCSTPGFLSITNSQSLLKLKSIESVMPSNHLILCHPLLLLPSIFPSIRVFSNESVLPIMCQSIGASASVSVLPMNIQDWFPVRLTRLISLQSKGLSRVLSSTTVQKHIGP